MCIKGLEKLETKAVPSAYIFFSKTEKRLILDIKALNASFRRMATKNNLLDREGFKVDAQELVGWHLSCNNRLVKLKLKGVIKVEVPRIDRAERKDVDDQQSGLYMIKALCHHFDTKNSYTSLELIRDTFGPQEK